MLFIVLFFTNDSKCSENVTSAYTTAENTFSKSRPTAKNPKLSERLYESQQKRFKLEKSPNT